MKVLRIIIFYIFVLLVSSCNKFVKSEPVEPVRPSSLTNEQINEINKHLQSENFQEAYQLIESGKDPRDNLNRYLYLSKEFQDDLPPATYEIFLQNAFSYAKQVPGKKDELFIVAKLNKIRKKDNFTLEWTQGIYHLVNK